MLTEPPSPIQLATEHLTQTARAVLDHDPNRVLGHLQLAHTADPSNREIAWALAQSYFRLNLPHEILAVLNRLPAADHEIQAARSNALRLLGRVSEAIQAAWWFLDAEQIPEQARGRSRWDGGSLAGQTLILHPSNAYVPFSGMHVTGFGDMIQVVQLCGALADRDDVRILVAVPPPLTRLMATARGVAGVLPLDGAWPPSDVCASFWRFFDFLCRDGLPPGLGRLPYLHAPPDTRLMLPPAPAGTLRVGLALTTSLVHTEQERRLSPVALAPLFDLPGIAWSVVEPGSTAADLQALKVPVHDLSSQLTDFAETAAAIRSLDLVVTVDTAVAHLAAALGKETWILLPCPPNIRWEAARLDSAWYATVRLFRQRIPNVWVHPVLEVRDQLRKRLQID